MKGVIPAGPVPAAAINAVGIRAIRAYALAHQIAVGEQDWAGVAVGTYRDLKSGHDVRPVRVKRYASESLGFALREEITVRPVEPRKAGIGLRIDAGIDAELEHKRWVQYLEASVSETVLLWFEVATVDADVQQLKCFTIQEQGRGAGVGV